MLVTSPTLTQHTFMVRVMSTAKSTVSYRNCPGHPGYRVGDDGSVWSCWESVVIPKHGAGFIHRIGTTWKRKRIKPTAGQHPQVSMGRSIVIAVHRLVLEAFVGPCPDGMEGCHFPDRNPANNRLENLRWDTPKSNAADKVIHGTDNTGERHGLAKLTDEIVLAIRADHATGNFTYPQLGRKYNVDATTIYKIVKRKRWAHI